MKSFSSSLQAILLMLLSMAFFSAMNIVIRLLSDDMASTQMVFLRNACALGIIIAWEMARKRGLPKFKTARIKGHFWRATIGVMAMELWFHAVTLMPVTLAIALSFTTPIFSTIIAIVFLGEKAGWHRWGAIATGIAGMLIILRPGLGGVGPEALFVIASSSMMAIAGVLIKTLTRTESPETIVFYMALFMTPWSLLPAIPDWQPFTAHQFRLVFVIALLSTVAHLLLARAFMRAEMVMLMPLDFSRLIFTALFAYVAFGETLDAPTILGSLVIVASTVYIARRETRKRTMPPPALP